MFISILRKSIALLSDMDLALTVNIFSVLANIAALILIVLAILQLRAINRGRETDLTMRVFDRFRNDIFVSSHDWISQNISAKSSDKIDYFSEEGRKIRKVAIVFEEAGALLKMKSIRRDLILSLLSELTISTWSLLEKFIEKERKRQRDETLWDYFEYLKTEAIDFKKQ